MTRVIGVYKKLPFIMRNALKYFYSIIPLRFRLGKEFYRQLAFLEQSQWWSVDEIAAYQNAQLRALVRHAYTQVPYYREMFNARGLTPNDIQSTADLVKLPILTRDDLRHNYERMRARNFRDRNAVKFSTSGTTGAPVMFYFDKKKDHLNADPFSWRFFGWAGHRIGELRATISCWTTEGRISIYNPVRDLLVLSAYNISQQSVGAYADALRKYNVEYIDGYPGTLELLTQFLQKKHIPPPVLLKAIFCHSEYLHDWQRQKIETYWGCKCFNWYSMEESVVFGIECTAHDGLHLCPEFGITEFLDSDVAGYKRIIATGFNNYATPLLRYDTSDLGVPLDRQCSCGRHFPLFAMAGGRKRNFAVAKDGSYIPVTNIDIPEVSDHVWQFQFVQTEQGKMTLLIVKMDCFTESDLRNIRRKLILKFGDNMDIAIRFIDSNQLIRHGRNQKTQILIQCLEINGITRNA